MSFRIIIAPVLPLCAIALLCFCSCAETFEYKGKTYVVSYSEAIAKVNCTYDNGAWMTASECKLRQEDAEAERQRLKFTTAEWEEIQERNAAEQKAKLEARAEERRKAERDQMAQDAAAQAERRAAEAKEKKRQLKMSKQCGDLYNVAPRVGYKFSSWMSCQDNHLSLKAQGLFHDRRVDVWGYASYDTTVYVSNDVIVGWE